MSTLNQQLAPLQSLPASSKSRLSSENSLELTGGDRWPNHVRHSRPSCNAIVLPQLNEDAAPGQFKTENIIAAISAGLVKAQKNVAERNAPAAISDSDRDGNPKNVRERPSQDFGETVVNLPTTSPFRREVDDRIKKIINQDGSEDESPSKVKQNRRPPLVDSSADGSKATTADQSKVTMTATTATTSAAAAPVGSLAPSSLDRPCEKPRLRDERMPGFNGKAKFNRPSRSAIRLDSALHATSESEEKACAAGTAAAKAAAGAPAAAQSNVAGATAARERSARGLQQDSKKAAEAKEATPGGASTTAAVAVKAKNASRCCTLL